MSTIIDNDPVDYVFKSAIVDREKRIVSGLVTVEKVDRERDIIDRDSVKSAFKSYMRNPVVLVFHNDKKPVAKTTDHKNEISKSNNPAIRIWVQHGFSNSPDSEVEKSWELVDQGILNGFSLRVSPSYTRKNGRITRIFTKELLEISYVTLPGNDETLIDSIQKSLDLNPNGVIEMEKEELLKALSGFKDEISKEITDLKGDFTKQLEDVKTSIPEAETPPEETSLVKALKDESFKKELDTYIEDKVTNSKQIGVLSKALGIAKGEDDQDTPEPPKKEPTHFGVTEYQDFIKSLDK